MVFTLIFYLAAGVGLTISFIADHRKTVLSLQKAWKAFSGILPEFLMIIIATGLILAFVSSLMMVGVVTFSMARKTFGTRIAL